MSTQTETVRALIAAIVAPAKQARTRSALATAEGLLDSINDAHTDALAELADIEEALDAEEEDDTDEDDV